MKQKGGAAATGEEAGGEQAEVMGEGPSASKPQGEDEAEMEKVDDMVDEDLEAEDEENDDGGDWFFFFWRAEGRRWRRLTFFFWRVEGRR